jgi:hypothetical protein
MAIFNSYVSLPEVSHAIIGYINLDLSMYPNISSKYIHIFSVVCA